MSTQLRKYTQLSRVVHYTLVANIVTVHIYNIGSSSTLDTIENYLELILRLIPLCQAVLFVFSDYIVICWRCTTINLYKITMLPEHSQLYYSTPLGSEWFWSVLCANNCSPYVLACLTKPKQQPIEKLALRLCLDQAIRCQPKCPCVVLLTAFTKGLLVLIQRPNHLSLEQTGSGFEDVSVEGLVLLISVLLPRWV